MVFSFRFGHPTNGVGNLFFLIMMRVIAVPSAQNHRAGKLGDAGICDASLLPPGDKYKASEFQIRNQLAKLSRSPLEINTSSTKRLVNFANSDRKARTALAIRAFELFS